MWNIYFVLDNLNHILLVFKVRFRVYIALYTLPIICLICYTMFNRRPSYPYTLLYFQERTNHKGSQLCTLELVYCIDTGSRCVSGWCRHSYICSSKNTNDLNDGVINKLFVFLPV